MPRPRIATYWQEALKEFAANDKTAGTKAAHTALRQRAKREAEAGQSVPQVPEASTVGRYLKKYRAEPEKMVEYRFFRWPGSMEAGLLPWDAGRIALDYVHHCMTVEPAGKHPTIREVRWAWRVHLAAPSMCWLDVATEARRLAGIERAQAARGGAVALEDYTLYMAFQPWENLEAADAWAVYARRHGVSTKPGLTIQGAEATHGYFEETEGKATADRIAGGRVHETSDGFLTTQTVHKKEEDPNG